MPNSKQMSRSSQFLTPPPNTNGRAAGVPEGSVVPRWTTVGSLNDGSNPSPTVSLSSFGFFEGDLCRKSLDQPDGELAYVPGHYKRLSFDDLQARDRRIVVHPHRASHLQRDRVSGVAE